MYAWICVSISFNTSTVIRRRASDSPARWATLRRNVSPAASRKEGSRIAITELGHHDERLVRLLGDKGLELPRHVVRRRVHRRSALAGRFRRRAVELGRRALTCVIGLSDWRAASAAARRNLRAAAGNSATAALKSSRITYAIADNTPPSDDDHQRGADDAPHAQAFERGHQRPQRIAQQDCGDDGNEKRLGNLRAPDHNDGGDTQRRDSRSRSASVRARALPARVAPPRRSLATRGALLLHGCGRANMSSPCPRTFRSPGRRPSRPCRRLRRYCILRPTSSSMRAVLRLRFSRWSLSWVRKIARRRAEATDALRMPSRIVRWFNGIDRRTRCSKVTASRMAWKSYTGAVSATRTNRRRLQAGAALRARGGIRAPCRRSNRRPRTGCDRDTAETRSW